VAISEVGVQPHVRLTEEFTKTAELLQRSTVQVRSGRWGGGSGVIWSPDGLIVTNAHVAHGPRAAVELWDGRQFESDVIGADPRRDVAALRVDAHDLPAAPIGDSDALRVGQLVVAVGNPLGLSGALTVGIVHAIAPIRRNRQTWVQADVRLAPGNSGGPLADVQGRVLGINSMIAGGLGLAVPSNAVAAFLRGTEQRPRLGVMLQPVVVRLQRQEIAGMLVLETLPDSPAAGAGLIMGDVLIGSGGRFFGEAADLATVLNDIGVGGIVHLDVLRGGAHITRDVIVGTASGGSRHGDQSQGSSTEGGAEAA
jgi:serine protease Do